MNQSREEIKAEEDRRWRAIREMYRRFYDERWFAGNMTFLGYTRPEIEEQRGRW